jgi:hypothetical protein
MLFMALAPVTLTDQVDIITWKWTPNGQYTVASAYECQFLGAMTKFPAIDIWKAFAEPKAKFFGW